MSEEPRPISVKVRAAIDAIVAGTAKTISDVADQAGLSREHLSRELSKPHVTEHLRQKIKRSLAVGAARAGATKLALLDSPNEMVRDRASSFVLGLIGIVHEAAPVDRSSVQLAGLQIVIVQPPAITAPPPRVIGPEPVRQIEPAQIEQEYAAKCGRSAADCASAPVKKTGNVVTAELGRTIAARSGVVG